MIDDEELRGIFKATSDEHLQNLDHGVLHLEKHPDDRTVLEALMREAHSLKGDANMLGAKNIGTLAHQMEHLLSQLQQQNITFSQELGDRLAEGITALRQLVHEATTGEAPNVNLFRVLARLMGDKRHHHDPGEPFEPAIAPPEEHPLPDHPDQRDDHTDLEHQQLSLSTEEDPLKVVSLHPALPSEPLLDNTSTLASNLPESSDSSTPVTATLEIPTTDSNPAAEGTLSLTYSSASSEAIRLDQGEQYRIETIRVKTASLDSLMTQIGELTVTKIRIAHQLAEVEAIANLWEECNRARMGSSHSLHPTTHSRDSLFVERLEQLGEQIYRLRRTFSEDVTRLEHITNQLGENIRTLRLLPISTLLNLLPRMVRDLARQQGKQVDLVMEGGETCADKRILEEMKDPLMHLIRNAIDHGVEAPGDRINCGKSATASISIRCYQTSTHIVLEIQDDGRGLDLDRIKRTALKRDLCREEDLATMTSGQIESLIFAPGLSTAPIVTEVSGRGVGLDVVQTNVEKLKGTLQVESHPGQGCLFRIQLGKTLATAHVLIVSVQNTPYAIPVEAVDTACLIHPEEIFTLEGRETIVRDDQPISVVRLDDLLELGTTNLTLSSQSQQFICIILQVGRQRFGVIVDDLVDEQDVVIKPQTGLLKRVRNVSGATILGTGEVCTVLNPQDLLKSVQRKTGSTLVRSQRESATTKPTVLLVEDSIAIRIQEKRMLESSGYDVVTAVDGKDGFSKLQSQSFDAIISDVQMPNMDGLQLTTQVRQYQQFNEIPIILVTSLASDDDKRRGAEAGANAYITKSTLNQKLLIETLQRLM